MAGVVGLTWLYSGGQGFGGCQTVASLALTLAEHEGRRLD